MTRVRPDFGPNQVRDPNEIVPGMFLLLVCLRRALSAQLVRVAGIPCIGAYGTLMVPIEFLGAGGTLRRLDRSLADHSVVVYGADQWGDMNCLLRTSATTLEIDKPALDLLDASDREWFASMVHEPDHEPFPET